MPRIEDPLIVNLEYSVKQGLTTRDSPSRSFKGDMDQGPEMHISRDL